MDLHYNEIAREIVRIVQDGLVLLADADGTDVIAVASASLTPGTVVSIGDDLTPPRKAVVEEVVDASHVRLAGPVPAEYAVARRATVRPIRPGEPDIRWIGQGIVELMPEPRMTGFPCIVVRGGIVEQPLSGGTNRTYAQDYHYHVYYLQRQEADEAADSRVMDEAGVIFRRLMADTYLGGTCWYSQVVKVDPRPKEEAALRERGLPVRVVEMELVARRAESGWTQASSGG